MLAEVAGASRIGSWLMSCARVGKPARVGRLEAGLRDGGRAPEVGGRIDGRAGGGLLNRELSLAAEIVAADDVAAVAVVGQCLDADPIRLEAIEVNSEATARGSGDADEVAGEEAAADVAGRGLDAGHGHADEGGADDGRRSAVGAGGRVRDGRSVGAAEIAVADAAEALIPRADERRIEEPVFARAGEVAALDAVAARAGPAALVEVDSSETALAE